jgi:hypothetical protein
MEPAGFSLRQPGANLLYAREPRGQQKVEAIDLFYQHRVDPLRSRN